MGCGRALLCILLPPLAVLDAGCGTIVIVTLLTLIGWVPGAIAALVIVNQNENARRQQSQLHWQHQQQLAQQQQQQQWRR